MLQATDAMVAYRAHPHVDCGATMFNGMLAELSPTAGLRIEGVDIALRASKAQMFAQLIPHRQHRPRKLKHLGKQQLGAFVRGISTDGQGILVAKVPGSMLTDPTELP